MEHPKNDIIHRELDTDRENPAVQIAETIAEIEEKEATNLANTYKCVDGVLTEIFSTPPSPEAQMQVEFSYEGYRITIEQNGSTKFVKTE